MLLLCLLLLVIRIVPPLSQPFTFFTPVDSYEYMTDLDNTYFQNVGAVTKIRQILLLVYYGLCSCSIYQQRHLNTDYALMRELVPMLALAIAV
jgi:hypothetical protein